MEICTMMAQNKKKHRFQRIHTSYIQHHDRTAQLREQVRQSWARACRFDGIDPESTMAGWSDGNPHRITYDAAVAALRDHLNG
jgi:hypothetical protein